MEDNKKMMSILEEILKTVKGLEKRMDSIEKRMDKIESRMDKIEKRMDKLESRFDNDCVFEDVKLKYGENPSMYYIPIIQYDCIIDVYRLYIECVC